MSNQHQPVCYPGTKTYWRRDNKLPQLFIEFEEIPSAWVAATEAVAMKELENRLSWSISLAIATVTCILATLMTLKAVIENEVDTATIHRNSRLRCRYKYSELIGTELFFETNSDIPLE